MQLSYLSKLIWLYVMFCVMLLTIVKVFWVINIARELSWVTCTTHPNWVPRAITPTNMKLSELNGSFYGVKIYIFMFWFSHSRVAWWWLFFFLRGLTRHQLREVKFLLKKKMYKYTKQKNKKSFSSSWKQQINICSALYKYI
jgi:hypothetical protein